MRKPNKPINSDRKELRSFVAPPFAAGYGQQRALRMRLLTFLAPLLCIFYASASASVDECKKYKQENPVYSQSKCRCNNFQEILQTPPSQFQGLKLAAACDYEIRDSEPRLVGDFFFQGEQIISGIIRREPSEFTDEFTLLGEKRTPWPERPPLSFRNVVYLQFNDALMAEKAFKAPKPTQKTPCFEAKARLKIMAMQSVFGIDNREGDFPQKYNVLSVGPYRKCLNPTPDPFAKDASAPQSSSQWWAKG